MTLQELIDLGWSIRVFTHPSDRLVGLGGPGKYGYLAHCGDCRIGGTADTWEALEAELTDRHEQALANNVIRPERTT